MVVGRRPALAVRLAGGVALRPEPFGAIAYVAERDDFFALDHAHAAVALRAAATAPTATPSTAPSATPPTATPPTAPTAPTATAPSGASGASAGRARTLAALGILETVPPTPQRPHLGRSLVGDLDGLPPLREPLVVNCFSTAHCPLLCAYCHADDLMVPFRRDEGWTGVEAVASTAALVPAMVGVVTGGDPIARPRRAAWLVARLAETKRVVLDTSGVGDIVPLLPALVRHRAHVRISLDSADPEGNDRARPVSPAYLGRGASGWQYAHGSIRRLQDAGVPCSVQTVVGSHNDNLDDLLALRDHLLDVNVRHWVLHVAVPAGKAAKHRGVLPGEGVLDRVRALVADCATGGVPLDIRVTGTHRTPNSVLLIDPVGRLCVERADGRGKRVIWSPEPGAGAAPDAGNGNRGGNGGGNRGGNGNGGGNGGGNRGGNGNGGGPDLAAWYRRHVDPGGHASRYLNGTLEPAPQPVAVR